MIDKEAMLKTKTIIGLPAKTFIIIGLSLYILLGLYSIHWLADSMDYKAGYDFGLYLEALTKAETGQTPYMPDKTSQTLAYHPFSLVVLSAFSWLGAKGAHLLWVGLSLVAWVTTIWVLIKLTKSAGNQLNNHWPLWIIWLIFLTYAPFWELLFMGQINAFVVLPMVLSFYYSENKRPYLAGICLALAIAFKLTPAFLLLYFLLMRQYRIILVSLATLVILALIAAVQFGWFVVNDFIAILPVLGADFRPTKHNQSILGLSYRFLTLYTDVGLKNALIIFQKVFFAGILGVIFLVGLNNVSWTRQARLWLFATLVVFVTISSPVVWYHHTIFLVFPLFFMMRYRPQYLMNLSIIIIALIQGNRLFEQQVAWYAVPALVAHFILFGTMITIYIKATEPRHKKLLPWLGAGFFALLILTGLTLRDDDGVLLTKTVKQALSPTKPIAADYGVVTLEGYRVDLTRLQARSEIYLTTFWQPVNSFADIAAELPIKVFVHLRNQNNQNVAQADHVLFGEAGEPQPFTQYIAISDEWDWAKEKDNPLADQTTIVIPENLPAGTYQIHIGLYDPDTSQRYPVANDVSGESSILLGSIEIGE